MRSRYTNVLSRARTLLGDGSLRLSAIKTRRPLKQLTTRELIQLESEIGRTLFGPIPKKHRREFFNLDPHTWMWHEEWRDATGARHEMTTKYEIRENGIAKIQPGLQVQWLEGEEFANFQLAVQQYYERVMREVYQRDPNTGYSLG